MCFQVDIVLHMSCHFMVMNNIYVDTSQFGGVRTPNLCDFSCVKRVNL